jgi:hypothetical protein
VIIFQCAITVFDGLLPEPHNSAITELLFVMAHWHAMAKLRMHNDLTLEILEAATVSLGSKLRKFSQTTCSAFETKELRREYNACMRQHANKAAAKTRRSPDKDSSNNPETVASETVTNGLASQSSTPQSGLAKNQPGKRMKTFNLNTFKEHSLGDYV